MGCMSVSSAIESISGALVYDEVESMLAGGGSLAAAYALALSELAALEDEDGNGPATAPTVPAAKRAA